MEILIEAIGIDKPGGGRTSIINLLDNIFKLDSQNGYTLLVSNHENIFDLYQNVAQIIVPFKNRFLARLWAQIMIPFRFSKFDLIHFTKNLSVFFLKTPYLITIHDLTVLVYPRFSPWIDVIYWKTIQRWSINKARLIIAVSENTASDIKKFYKTEEDKIIVIYHGKNTFNRPATLNEIQNVKRKYNLPSNYIITVGRIDMKKNLTSLIKAFALIKDRIDPSIKIVLVGEVYKKSNDKALIPTIERFGLIDKVMFTGRVPDDDLSALYSGALVCAFPSLHEGFGLVALEAMACGTPLITHNSSAIVEVIGESGIKINAGNIYELGSALERVIGDEKLRENLHNAGIAQAKKFDWERSAEQTIESYKKITSNPK